MTTPLNSFHNGNELNGIMEFSNKNVPGHLDSSINGQVLVFPDSKVFSSTIGGDGTVVKHRASEKYTKIRVWISLMSCNNGDYLSSISSELRYINYNSAIKAWVFDLDQNILSLFNTGYRYAGSIEQIGVSSGWEPASEPSPNLLPFEIPEFVASDNRLERSLMTEGFTIEMDVYSGRDVFLWRDNSGNPTFKALKDYVDPNTGNTIIKGELVPYNHVY